MKQRRSREKYKERHLRPRNPARAAVVHQPTPKTVPAEEAEASEEETSASE